MRLDKRRSDGNIIDRTRKIGFISLDVEKIE